MKHILYSLLVILLLSSSGFAQCSELVRKAHKFSDKTVVMTTCRGKRSADAIHYKRVYEQGQVYYFVQLYVESGSFLPQKGASVFFKDGTSLDWPTASVESTFDGNIHTSQSTIRLTEEAIELLQEKQIASIKLYVHDRALNQHQSIRAQDILNCVIGADLIEVKSDKVVSQ
ncbi:hypothetical protein [Spirosoma oryzicola]|uniref:hypothetical protein n=1 Tax=Spirosoma oryzicola TaxID=2898794 RepID=UPI001E41758A|nr:hypothetical protein [Spirosoma oryzicola]UHG91093.1 hypothetical protein LQ777_23010 [Spirosoma oryzicola]